MADTPPFVKKSPPSKTPQFPEDAVIEDKGKVLTVWGKPLKPLSKDPALEGLKLYKSGKG